MSNRNGSAILSDFRTTSQRFSFFLVDTGSNYIENLIIGISDLYSAELAVALLNGKVRIPVCLFLF